MKKMILVVFLLANAFAYVASAAATGNLENLKISAFSEKSVTQCDTMVLESAEAVVTFDGSHGKFQMSIEDRATGQVSRYVTKDFYYYGAKGLIHSLIQESDGGAQPVELRFAGVGIERALVAIVNEKTIVFSPSSGTAVFQELREIGQPSLQ